MQSESGVLRACMALLLVVMASLAPHRLVQSEANAAQVSLRWDYAASGAAGFVLYCGPSSKNYLTRVDVGNTDAYIIGTLPAGATSFCAVTAYDPAKVESTFSNELVLGVPPPAPVVNFTVSPASGTAPLSVAFTNASTGQVNTWAWDFGDGTSSNVNSPTHVYTTPGSYVAVLSAAGAGGTASKTAATAIVVSAPALPVVNFSATPASGIAPLSVAFTNTTTGSVTTWAWDFGDGTTSNVQRPTHVYSTLGGHTVVLTATGAGGTASKTATTAIVVSASALPVVNFSATPASGIAPLSVVFTNTTTGSVTTWAWDFGDGTTSNVQSPTHVYSTLGGHTVVLTATGAGGTASKTAATAIGVTAALPVASGFSVLGATVTCTSSVITGGAGVPPPGVFTNTGCTITGGTPPATDAAAAQEFAANFPSAYDALRSPTNITTCTQMPGNLGGLNLGPGVYCVDAVAKAGTLTLTGPSNGTWIFLVTGPLTGTNFSVAMAGGGQPCNVFWAPSGAAALTTSTFIGNILAGDATLGSITLSGGTLAGRALANVAVTMTGASIIACAR